MADLQQGSDDQLARWVRVGLALGLGYLLFLTFQPFLSDILWAAVLCYALYPLQRRLVRVTGGRANLSALLMCLLVMIAIVLPVLYLSLQIAEDLADTYKSVVAYLQSDDHMVREGWKQWPLVGQVVEKVQAYQQSSGKDIKTVLADNLAGFGKSLIEQLTRVAANVLSGLFDLSVILLGAFFFFRDGEAAVQWFRALVPIPDDRLDVVSRRFDEVVMGSIYGNTLVAAIEGVIGGLAFLLVGLPSPVLWGAVMGITAYLPMAGAGIVWVPAAIYLYFAGAYVKMGILIGAGVLIGLVDNIVRNVLVAGRVQMHPLLVFFGVLGGIQLFGLLGIVAGPLLVAVGRTVLEMYWIGRVIGLVSPPQA